MWAWPASTAPRSANSVGFGRASRAVNHACKCVTTMGTEAAPARADRKYAKSIPSLSPALFIGALDLALEVACNLLAKKKRWFSLVNVGGIRLPLNGAALDVVCVFMASHPLCQHLACDKLSPFPSISIQGPVFRATTVLSLLTFLFS